jgi:hypothetical protein
MMRVLVAMIAMLGSLAASAQAPLFGEPLPCPDCAPPGELPPAFAVEAQWLIGANVRGMAEVPPCFPLVNGDLLLWPPAIRWTSTLYLQPASLGVGETRSCLFDMRVQPALDGRRHDVHFAVAAHIDDPDPTRPTAARWCT